MRLAISRGRAVGREKCPFWSFLIFRRKKTRQKINRQKGAFLAVRNFFVHLVYYAQKIKQWGEFFVHSDEIKKNQKKSKKPIDKWQKMVYNSLKKGNNKPRSRQTASGTRQAVANIEN